MGGEQPIAPGTVQSSTSVPALDLNFSQLVGNEITVFSEQFPGQPIRTRVLSFQANELEVSASDKFIQNLVNRRPVILQLDYKGEQVAVSASLKRSRGGRSYFVLGRNVVPLSQRKFARVPIECPVKLAAFPVTSFSKIEVSKLRWMSTQTLNFSSGGALVLLSNFATRDIYCLMNVELPRPGLPDMVLAQVRHCYSHEKSKFLVGVEFMVKEFLSGKFSSARFRELPKTIHNYSQIDRERLNRDVQEWMHSGQPGS